MKVEGTQLGKEKGLTVIGGNMRGQQSKYMVYIMKMQ